jgi:hypothetical protein
MPKSDDPRIRTYTSLPIVGTVEGVTIHCDGSDGTFWALIAQSVVMRKNFADLKRLIVKQTVGGVKLLYVARGYSSWEQPDARAVVIMGIEQKSGHTHYRFENGHLDQTYSVHLYTFEPETEARLKAMTDALEALTNEYHDAKQKWEQHWHAEIEKLTRLSEDEVDAMCKAAKAR